MSFMLCFSVRRWKYLAHGALNTWKETSGVVDKHSLLEPLPPQSLPLVILWLTVISAFDSWSSLYDMHGIMKA